MNEKRDTPSTITEVRGDLPVLAESIRNNDTLQLFYRSVTDSFGCARGVTSGLYLRVSGGYLCTRRGNSWVKYGVNDRDLFWRDVMRQYPLVGQMNWSTKRMRDLWDYFHVYAEEITFDDRRYFEMGNCVLDGLTGELDYTADRFLRMPTTRHSELSYDKKYVPTPAWQSWYDTMDEHQRAVRDWSVGSAIIGEHGLLFTFGQSRTGKSTLAEGLREVLGEGAGVFSLSRDWGRFYTQHMDGTTYLYDADAKGSKSQNNTNYGTLHLMASGDPIQVELKGGALYPTTNYGFVEVISNAPTTLYFEQSIVDRVRFCLYTYIAPRSDGGAMKRKILADKQAWLNYAVGCGVSLAKGLTQRPAIDNYQMYGWVMWLKECNTYGALCVDRGHLLSYDEYNMSYTGADRFRLTQETVADMRAGIKELERQYGDKFLDQDWKYYGEELAKKYYGKTKKQLPKVSKIEL